MELPKNKAVVTCFDKAFISTDIPDSSSPDFAKPKPETRWCLLEASKEALATLEAGKPFFFQPHGDKDNPEIAMCTDSGTFGLEFLENSNSLFLGRVDQINTESDKENSSNANSMVNAGISEGDPVTGEDNSGKSEADKNLRCTIFAQCGGQLILKPIVVDAERVHRILQKHKLGDENAVQSDHTSEPASERVTTKMLQYEVAASVPELEKILKDGPYVEVEGAWYYLPEELQNEVTDAALALVKANGWDDSAVDLESLLEAVRSHFGPASTTSVPNSDVLRKALRGVEAEAKSKEAASDVNEGATPDISSCSSSSKISLDSSKVKTFQAFQLLRDSPSHVRERFNLPPPPPRAKRPRLGGATGTGRAPGLLLTEFVAALQALNGEDISAEHAEKILGTSAYLDPLEGTLHLLDVSALPQEPRQRLKRCFELQSHWKPEQLEALIAPCLGGQKVSVWMLKYTRAAFVEVENGIEQRLVVKKFVGLG